MTEIIKAKQPKKTKFSVVESFYTLQGEIDIGVPSVFVRFGGCNFRCQGFGMPKGELSTEGKDYVASDYASIDEVPVPKTGCDSPVAIWPHLIKKFSTFKTVDEIIEDTRAMLPNGKFGNGTQLVLTGGEPLLGWQKSFPELLQAMITELDLRRLTIETNGTIELDDALVSFLQSRRLDINFSVSAKLSSSGESYEKRFKPEAIISYCRVVNSVRFKFVTATFEDIQEIETMLTAYNEFIDDLSYTYSASTDYYTVFIMPCGADEDMYYANEKQVASWALERGWGFTPRLQVQLWDNAWGT